MSEQLNPSDAGGWQQWLASFDAVKSAFAQSYSNYQALAPYVQSQHPERLADYNALLARAASNQATILQLQQVADAVVPWLQFISSTDPFTAAFNAGESLGAQFEQWLANTFGLG